MLMLIDISAVTLDIVDYRDMTLLPVVLPFGCNAILRRTFVALQQSGGGGPCQNVSSSTVTSSSFSSVSLLNEVAYHFLITLFFC